MIENINWVAAAVFIFFFALVTVIGFYASSWKSGDLDALHEWGLGGRRFGTWITWFLLGGDLYTAYTVIAVPALVYATGAFGFFAVPYTIIIYPFIFLTMPRLWAVAHKHNYITGADFIRGRYDNKGLELAVAFTGILATMPYIALQLVGMEKVIQALGFQGGTGVMSHLPLTIAFVILALYTYKSGLRAPAMIAFVKDIMIYVFVIAAIIIIPYKLGGYGVIFSAADAAFAKKGGPTGVLLKPGQLVPYMTLALGSGIALFMYPHSMTGVLSASSGNAIKRNAMMLPLYSLVLGMIALLGLMGHAAGIQVTNPQDVVPQLFLKMFPDWFVGFVFAAIAIGALVPAAVMSIGASNTFTRNIWRLFDPSLAGAKEANLSKLVSLIVKIGALAFIIGGDTSVAINLQLLGGIWMSQIFPSLVFGLFTRWFNGTALLIGWFAGMAAGTYLAWGEKAWLPVRNLADFLPGVFNPTYSVVYNGLTAILVNILVSVVLTLVLGNKGADETVPSDYVSSAVADPDFVASHQLAR